MTAPSGASYPVDYIMDVKLTANKGSDIPLYDQRIDGNLENLERVWGKEFNFSEEDYWLFRVHLHDAEMEFAIHGHKAASATSKPNLHNISPREEYSEESQYWPFLKKEFTVWCEFNLEIR